MYIRNALQRWLVRLGRCRWDLVSTNELKSNFLSNYWQKCSASDHRHSDQCWWSLASVLVKRLWYKWPISTFSWSRLRWTWNKTVSSFVMYEVASDSCAFQTALPCEFFCSWICFQSTCSGLFLYHYNLIQKTEVITRCIVTISINWKPD